MLLNDGVSTNVSDQFRIVIRACYADTIVGYFWVFIFLYNNLMYHTVMIKVIIITCIVPSVLYIYIR